MTNRSREYQVAAREKRPLLEVFESGLRAGGARILEAPSPDVAPFEYSVETPDGERLRLIVYLFRATKYQSGPQRERPADEHRFQIKYGSDFQVYHWLKMPSPGDASTVTLFLGAHLEEGIFVGCDPAIHNPTWFSKSVEFKDEHIVSAREAGWFGWERRQVQEGRRKRPLPLLDLRTEALIAFTPKNLLRYVELERRATGLDPGERLLLAEHLALRVMGRHSLEIELGLSAGQILDMIEEEFRLKVAVRGSAAQWHLGKLLEKVPGLDPTPIDADSRPDFELRYRNRPRTVTVECKNVLRKQRQDGSPVVEYQKTRASKSDPVCGRFYTYRHCDILAACLHPVTESWSFLFTPSARLAAHPKCPGRVSPRIAVGGSGWTEKIAALLDELTA